MNTSNDPTHSAKSRLTTACRTKDTSVRLAWAITVGEAILIGGFALALMDYWLMLPVMLRTIGALGLLGLTAIGVFRLVRFYRRPTQLKEAALDVEAQKPELGCEVSTAAEYLSGERKTTHEYEPELAAALQAKAAKDLSATQVPYERKVIKPALLFTLTFLGLISCVVLAPTILTALQRTALPFSKAQYTTVSVQPGNVEIPVGHDLAISNVFSGRAPKDPQIHLQEAGDAQRQTIALARSEGGAFVYSLKNLKSDITYQVTGNDAVSEEFKIQTYVPPEVKEFDVRIRFPDYTKKPALNQKSPEITAVRASQAEIRLQPSVELGSARLRLSGLPDLPFAPGQDGFWTATLEVAKDADYWIELSDKKGHLGVNEKPYHIRALPDNPPKLEVTDPAKDIRAAATNKVPVKIAVSDDFGIGEVKVVLHKLGGSEQTITATRESEDKGVLTASAELDLSPLGLKEYELVAYHAEATDNNTLDGPGKGKSPVYFIEITNEEAGDCKSQSQAQRVNLLVIQKQIIADTSALAANEKPEKFDELSARQRDAVEFGQMYYDTISASGPFSPPAVEMHSALEEMKTAGEELSQQQRDDALPPEERALAHLYKVIQALPELQNMPTVPTMAQQTPPPSQKLRVVLQAIQQKKKEQPENKEIEDALEQAQKLAREQSGINEVNRNASESNGRGQGQNPSSNQNPNKAKSESQASAKLESKSKGSGKAQSQAETQAQAKAKGQGKGQGEGQGQGQGQGQEQAKAEGEKTDQQSPEKKEPARLAEKENELSREAAELAEKLERLAGKDTRLGHNAGRSAARAANRMANAGKAMTQGNFGAAGEHGFQGELAIRNVIAELERILKNQPEATDIASEDYPKEYETLISEYLKKLSHAE